MKVNISRENNYSFEYEKIQEHIIFHPFFICIRIIFVTFIIIIILNINGCKKKIIEPTNIGTHMVP